MKLCILTGGRQIDYFMWDILNEKQIISMQLSSKDQQQLFWYLKEPVKGTKILKKRDI